MRGEARAQQRWGFETLCKQTATVLVAVCFVLITEATWAGNVTVSADSNQPFDLNPYLEYLPDEQGAWTIEEISSPPLSGQFQPNSSGRPFSPGFTTTAYWYRLTLPLVSPAPPAVAGEWFLEAGLPYMDFVDFYAQAANGNWQAVYVGDNRPFSQRPVRHRSFVFPVSLSPERPTVAYLRVQTGGTHQVTTRLWSARGLYETAPTELIVLMLVNGFLLVMAAYSACLYAVLRERSYLDYTLLLLSFALLYLVLDGTGQQFLWGEMPQWSNAIVLLVWCLMSVIGTRFLQSFLNTRQHAPRYHRMGNIIIGLGLATPVVALVQGYPLPLRFSVFLWLLANAAGLVVVVSLFRSQSTVRFFLLAWMLPLLSVPLTTASTAGVLPNHPFVNALARAAVALGVVLFSLALADRFYQERRERERLGRLKRFFAPQVASAILEEGEEALLAPRRRDVTVLFTDLRGFTEFSAQSEPEEVIQVLRQYHEVVGRAVAQHGGTLEHFAGDGVMIYFNAPVEIKDPEASAARLAFDLRQQFETLCQDWQRRGHGLGVGIGMASGYATVGAVGYEGRRDYAAIGTVTNLASRLCGQAQHGEILVSQRLFTQIEQLVEAESLGEQAVKGLSKPVAVYRLLRLRGANGEK